MRSTTIPYSFLQWHDWWPRGQLWLFTDCGPRSGTRQGRKLVNWRGFDIISCLVFFQKLIRLLDGLESQFRLDMD